MKCGVQPDRQQGGSSTESCSFNDALSPREDCETRKLLVTVVFIQHLHLILIWYNMICLLTAVGLTAGGSSRVVYSRVHYSTVQYCTVQ